MKRTLTLLASIACVAYACATPESDVSAGTDLALRSVGGSYKVTSEIVSYSGTFSPTYSELVHIPKPANGLTASVATASLFPGTDISTTLTFTGATDTTANGIAWSVSDPSVIGKTLNVNVSGTSTPITVSSISGTVYMVASALSYPVEDPFDKTFRGTKLAMDTTKASSVVIGGTVEGFPVTVTITPNFAAVAGAAVTQFVTEITTETAAPVSGATYTGTVYLNTAATTGGVEVAFAGDIYGDMLSILIPAGQKSGTFKFTTGTIYSVLPGWISASANGFTLNKALSADPILASLAVVTNPAISGAPVTFSVSLNEAAPTGGVKITLHSLDSNLVVPPTVTVLAGEKSATFVATPAVVSTSNSTTTTSYTVQASYTGTYVSATLTLH
jgi:hypothetical protein